MMSKLRFVSVGLICFLWILLVLYPDPMLLIRSIPRAFDPPVNPQAVQQLAAKLPNDPKTIENEVLNKYVPYAVPWQTMGVPWYYPTTGEVIRMGKGDCEARMLVLASVLKAKHIPFKIEASLDHIWVKYPHKQQNAIENNGVAFVKRTNTGVKLQIPKGFNWRQSYTLEKEYFWDPMPAARKVVLFAGLVVILFHRRIFRAISALRHRLEFFLLTHPSKF